MSAAPSILTAQLPEIALQLNVSVRAMPNSLAIMCDRLRAADININAISCTDKNPHTIMHIIVDDAETAKIILQELGTVVLEKVLAFRLKNQRGAVGAVGRACAAAGVNIRNIYATTYGKEAMVYVVDDDVHIALKLIDAWRKGTFSGSVPTGQRISLQTIVEEKVEQVRSKQKQQEWKVDHASTEFLSFASHQLRTPLTVIRWGLGRLKKNLWEEISPDNQRLIQEALRASAAMGRTIDTMLNISRIESSEVPLTITTFPLGIFLQDIAALYAVDVERKDQRISIVCDPSITLRTDSHYLWEILSNLLSNAVKYTPEGGRITLNARAEQSGAVSISITDTGYGIPREQQQRIFAKFFRGENIVSRDTEGTGLGLYLAFLLMKLLGGTIRFTSVENQGTTFTLSLASL